MKRIHLSPHAFHGDWNYTIQTHNCKPQRIICFVTKPY